MKRLVSTSEIGSLLECERRHGFAYTGHLTGGRTLRRKHPALVLRRGRAWGRAVAAWHTTGWPHFAHDELAVALEEDAQQQRDSGVYDHQEHVDLLDHLGALLDHYMQTTERIPLECLERELRVTLPSRTGKQLSNRYAFQGYIDGLTRDFRLPGLWIVELKLRDRLMPLDQVAMSRQIRWYAWAAERQFDEEVRGVIVDERLNEVPKAPRVLKNGQPSHAKDQLCTAEDYEHACAAAGVDVEPETLRALRARDWQRRHAIFLRRDEIAEAGRELVSAAQAIAEMDAGDRYPLANRSVWTCGRCAYKDICNNPADDDLIDLDFERTTPKREREELPVAA